MAGILHGAVLGADLLAQLHGTGGAVLHAAAAGHAVLRLHLGNIGAAAQVGRVEELGCPQGVADVDVAVADAENLLLAVDVGDLVDEAVVLRLAENLKGLLLGDVAAPVGLHDVVCHVAHGDAPVLRIIGATLVEGPAGQAAGAGGFGVLTLVLVQPVGDVLDGDGLALGGDGLLHRDDVHADARAAGRHHGSDPLQGLEAHALEELAKLRVLLQLLGIHIRELGAAGDKQRDHIPLLVVRVLAVQVLPVVLDQAHHAHLEQQLLQMLRVLARELGDLGQGLGLADLHFQGDLGHLVGDDALEAPVFRVLIGDLPPHAVGDHLAQLQNDLPLGHILRNFIGMGVVVGHNTLPLFIVGYQLCQSRTCWRSQSAQASMPSPVLAQMGMIWMLGLRILAYSVTFSMSKSK